MSGTNVTELPDEVQKRIESGIAEYHAQVAKNNRLTEELSLKNRDLELSRLECDSLKRALEEANANRLRDIEEAKRDIAAVQGKLEATGHKLAQFQVLFGLVHNALEEFKREPEGEELPRMQLRSPDRDKIDRIGLLAVDGALPPRTPPRQPVVRQNSSGL